MKSLILTVVIGCMMISNVWAEHEVDHRYNIRGYILDGNQQAISNQTVRVFKESRLLKKGKTDSAGYYSLQLHLHNSDNNQVLRLLSGPNEAKLQVTFDASDLNTLRIHYANFVVGEFIEGKLNRFQIPPWIYPLIGLLALFFIAVKLEKRRKKKHQIMKNKITPKHSPNSRKSKKSRHRKH